MKIHRYLLPFAFLLLAGACSSPGNINGQNSTTADAEAPRPTQSISLEVGDAGAGYTTEGCAPIPCAPCPNGKAGTRFCPAKYDAGAVPQKIFAMAPRRFHGEWYPVEDTSDPTDGSLCLCESAPDAGTETALPPPPTPDAGIDVQTPTDTYVPLADAMVTTADAFVPPPVTVPDAGVDAPPAQTCFPPNRVMTDEEGKPVRWCGEGTIVVCREVWKCEDDPNPKPDASVPVTQPDAFVPLTVATPDAKPDTTPDTMPVLIPDTAPPVVIITPDAAPDTRPDSRPDLQPDRLPDTSPDVTPPQIDTQAPIDTYVAPDLAPDLRPDVKPDCGCVEKQDTAPACWHKTPWIDNITLTLEECGGVKVQWQPEDCSSNGYKVVWIRYAVDEDGNLDLPSYPNNADGYSYVGNVTQYRIEGLESGKWTIRVYKYPTGGGGTEGKYSAPEIIEVP